jgi:Fe-S cluster assembly protein SufB
MAAETFDLSELGTYKYGFAMPERYVYKARKGLSREIVEEISWLKGEPDWMREFRLRALEIFLAKPMPTWGADLSGINFDDIYYYIKPTDKKSRSWDEVPEEIRRTFELLGIPEAERKFLAGVGAQYECLSGEVRVYTARGPIPIRDVQPGDIVFSYEEESGRLIPARVRATAFKGEREVFEVRVGTRTIRATANHPFLVLEHERASNRQRGRYRLTWKYLYELKPGDLVAVARRLPDVGAEYALQPLDSSAVPTHAKPVRFPERTSTDLMWWLGVYIGDGFLRFDRRGSKGRIEFAIPETDEALRRELQRVTRELFGIEARNGDPYRLTVYSTALARYLKAHGFEGNAHTKRVPQWVFSLPEEQRLAFLGGYVDADGYVRNHRGNRNVVLTSVNAALLEDMQALARTCGIRTSNIHRFESKHPKDPERRIIGYRLQLSGDFERIGCRSPQRIERFGLRKYHHKDTSAHNTTFRSHINEFIGFARIDAIIPAGVEPVYDIEVEGPHNFVAEGLIVHNSEVVYHNLQEHLRKLGVIFVDTDTAVREYPDLVREYFGTVVPPDDNKFAALNSAVWSGGSFIYVPPGVHVDLPLQAYFRINAQNVGQFERTLIIAEEGSFVHYVEGCTAPIYTTDSLHSAVVEIIVKPGARVRYTTIQNWSTNVYNLVTKRAVVYRDAVMEWVDCNLGSKVTMKYPSVYLMEPGARGEILSIAFAGRGQHQDAGGKAIHAAPHTRSRIISKSISKDGGRTSYRGLVRVYPGAEGSTVSVNCDALILDEISRSDTYPYMEIEEDNVTIGHEATVSKISDEQLFYLMSRGIPQEEAAAMIVTGFVEPLVKELPMEYAVEMNRLIRLQMSGSVG